MFYRILKEFLLKKIVNKRLLNYQLEDSIDKIKTVGVLIDESNFQLKDALLYEIKSSGLVFESVKFLVFKDKIKAKEIINEPFYTVKDLSLSGKISKAEVVNFVEEPFDMLINFYNEPKATLNMVAKKSVAKFKVGFSSIDKRINHLIIHSDVENQKEFISELVKYLRILNKI